MNSAVFVTLLALVGLSQSLDQCPQIKGVANLDVSKLTGIWYSTWESSPPFMPCLSYDITQLKNGQINTRMIPYQLELQGAFNDQSDSSKNLKMIAPLPLLDGAEWTIVHTDYVNVTAIFTCKITEKKNFQSVTFWSRNPALSTEDLNKLKGIYTDLGLTKQISTLQPIVRGNLLCKGLGLGGKVLEDIISVFRKFFGGDDDDDSSSDSSSSQ